MSDLTEHVELTWVITCGRCKSEEQVPEYGSWCRGSSSDAEDASTYFGERGWVLDRLRALCPGCATDMDDGGQR